MDSVEYLGASGSMLSLNLYAYCENNPIMYVDPDGKWIIPFPINLMHSVFDLIIKAINNKLSEDTKKASKEYNENVVHLGITEESIFFDSHENAIKIIIIVIMFLVIMV